MTIASPRSTKQQRSAASKALGAAAVRGIERQAERDIKRALKRSGTPAKIVAGVKKLAPLAPASGVVGVGVAAPIAVGLAQESLARSGAEKRVQDVEKRLGKLPPAARAALLQQHYEDIQKKASALIVKPGVSRLLG